MSAAPRGLSIYWYWPFPHLFENRLALSMRRPEDRLTIQSLSTRFGQPVTTEVASYETVRDLPEPTPAGTGTVRWAFSRARTYWARARRRASLLGSRHFDVAHIFSLNLFTDAWTLRSIARKTPLVSTVHDVYPHEPRIPSTLQNRLLANVYRNAGTLVVAHEWMHSQLIENFDVDPERIEIVPLPVHRAHVSAEVVEASSMPTVLFFGRFRQNKGIPQFLKAIETLGDVDELRFVFAGRGSRDLEQRVQAAADRDGRITADLRFIPEDRKDALYRTADLVVLPYTNFASQSGVLSDAYAYGIPVIGTDVGALGETIREDGSGWVVRAGDAEALAAAILDAVTDDEARKQKAALINRVAAERSFDAVGQRIRQLYERLVT